MVLPRTKFPLRPQKIDQPESGVKATAFISPLSLKLFQLFAGRQVQIAGPKAVLAENHHPIPVGRESEALNVLFGLLHLFELLARGMLLVGGPESIGSIQHAPAGQDPCRPV